MYKLILLALFIKTPLGVHYISLGNMERGVVVAQLVEWLLLIPEVHSSNPVIGKNSK